MTYRIRAKMTVIAEIEVETNSMTSVLDAFEAGEYDAALTDSAAERWGEFDLTSIEEC